MRSNQIDAQAEFVQNEIIEKKLTAEQLEEGFAEQMAAKMAREEAEFQEWEQQQVQEKQEKFD